MKKFCKHAIKILCLGTLLVSITSCAPYYPESNYKTESDTPISAEEQQQIIRQVEETLLRAEAHVRAGQARLQENRPIDARYEFDRARLLLAQNVDPTLNYVNQMSIQGGVEILRSQTSGIAVRRRELEREIANAEQLESLCAKRQKDEKLNDLRRKSRGLLQPIDPPTSYYGPSASYKSQSFSVQAPRGNFEDEIERNIEILRRQGEGFRQCLLRANSYFPRVTSVLVAEGVPEVLAYVALLESGYQPEARSSSGKAGLWQFSPSQARQYGLTVNASYDERLQLHASTRAFARHMLRLYRQYGNWVQAIAALSSDQDYLARFLAANRIANNPRQYGFYLDLHNMTGRYDLLRGRGRIQFFSESDFWGTLVY